MPTPCPVRFRPDSSFLVHSPPFPRAPIAFSTVYSEPGSFAAWFLPYESFDAASAKGSPHLPPSKPLVVPTTTATERAETPSPTTTGAEPAGTHIATAVAATAAATPHRVVPKHRAVRKDNLGSITASIKSTSPNRHAE